VIERGEMREHPEALIDLALHGRLEEAQWRNLREHLVACRPCSTQIRLAGWMNRDAGDDLADALMRDRITLSRVLERWEQGRPRRRFPLVPRWVLIGAAAVALSGATAAATWWSSRQTRPEPQPPPSMIRARTSRPRLPPAIPATSPPEAPAPEQTVGEQPAKLIRKEQPAASVLFARASDLRSRGQIAAAVATFRRLQRLYPDSRESGISPLVLGRLWLENGRADLAAPEFSRYLKSGGAASEEALMGHAVALRRMGRVSEEAADWNTLLDEYPGSLYAADARRRLDELAHARSEEAPRRSGHP
jgi:TolA-binding protein